MLDFIMVPAIMAIITYGVYKLFELFARRKERIMIIEKTDFSKGGLQQPSLDVNYEGGGRFKSLKFSCLLLGLGAGLFVGFLISVHTDFSNIDTFIGKYDIVALVIGSSVLLFGGIGMLTSFILEQVLGKKK